MTAIVGWLIVAMQTITLYCDMASFSIFYKNFTLKRYKWTYTATLNYMNHTRLKNNLGQLKDILYDINVIYWFLELLSLELDRTSVEWP